MINVNKFKSKVVENGFNLTTFAEKVGVDYSTLYRKLNGRTPFTVSDVESIARVLKLTEEEIMDIFFNKTIA